MTNLWQSFLVLLGGSSESELAQQNQYLKVENEILRSKLPGRVHVTAKERERLLRFARPLGKSIRQLVSIVSIKTFLRWLREPDRTPKPGVAQSGRPRTADQLRDLVLKMACENSWGYTRIHGELEKLGLAKISRTTVANILRAAGIDTAPERNKSTWANFIKRHADTLFACDFFTKKVWTLTGLKTYYVLFFIHVATRRVHFSGFTTNPDNAWMIAQAKTVADYFGTQPVEPTHLIRDRDGKFVPAFDAALKEQGIEVVLTAPRCPNQNAFAERFVLSVKSECLDHFVVFGEAHLRLILSEYEQHFNAERPHQGRDNQLLTGEVPAPAAIVTAGQIQCSERLGGLVKHYYHQAA